MPQSKPVKMISKYRVRVKVEDKNVSLVHLIVLVSFPLCWLNLFSVLWYSGFRIFGLSNPIWLVFTSQTRCRPLHCNSGVNTDSHLIPHWHILFVGRLPRWRIHDLVPSSSPPVSRRLQESSGPLSESLVLPNWKMWEQHRGGSRWERLSLLVILNHMYLLICFLGSINIVYRALGYCWWKITSRE